MKELSLTRDEYEALSQENKCKQEQIKLLNEQLAVKNYLIGLDFMQKARERKSSRGSTGGVKVKKY